MKETTMAPRAYVLGGELRDIRLNSGLGLRQLATKLDVSHSVVVRWERGERVPSTESVAAVCALLGVNGGTRDRLLKLARDAATEPANTVSIGTSGEDDQVAALLRFERAATDITYASPVLIPGLLQTAEYARAIMSPDFSSSETDKLVMLRLGRRDLITRRHSPARFTAFLLEAALHQSIGGPEVIREQLEFLLEMGARENIEIRVIPTSAGWTPVHIGPFFLMEFGRAGPVVHLEHHRSAVFLRDPSDVQTYTNAREKIDRVAMSSADTAQLIVQILDQEEFACDYESD